MNGDKFWKVTQVVITLTSLLITAMVIPWGTWVTKTIHQIELQQVEFNSWKNVGPRFTNVDAENLRLKVLTEMNDRVDKKLDRLLEEVGKTRDELRQHLKESHTKP